MDLFLKYDKIEKEWDFIISETHREKPLLTNIIKREALFIMQNLLINISELEFKANRKKALKIYFITKDFYLRLN